MANEIKMPQLSDTMSSGKILSWSKKEGDVVKRGDIVAEVETDKANLEIEAFQSGVLLKIEVLEGETAKVGQVIALIGEAGESTSSSASSNSQAKTSEIVPNQVVAHTTNGNSSSSNHSLTSQTASQSYASQDEQRVKVSPLAKKLAERNSVDLSTLQGSGPNGRIIKKDIERVAEPTTQTVSSTTNIQAPAAKIEVIPQAIASSDAKGQMKPLSKMRATIAERMQQAVHESPHFFTTIEIEMSRAKESRETLKLIPEYKGLGINHLVIKAAAYALKHERRVNCAMKSGMLYEPNDINIGIITAVPDGLLIPVIKNADQLNLKDIVFESRAAIERARAGRPTASDLSGGTFSISNMGMYDVENFTAIINPGQGGILAISAMKEKPIVVDGKIVIGSVMKVTLSVDHRIIDGVAACQFLKYFKKGLENPVILLA